MNKIKILYIHHGTGIGGAPISLVNLIKHLDKDKFEVKVASLKGGAHIDLFKKEGIDIEVIGAPTIYFSHNETNKKQWYYLPYYIIVLMVWLYIAFYKAPKYLRDQEYDIVHLNSHVLTSWAYAAKRLNFKVILHNREAITKGYFGIRYRILKRLIKSNCDYIINISRDNMERLGIMEKACVIYNFIDIPKKYRETMPVDVQMRKVLYVGGAALIKGFDTVVDSITYLGKNIELLVAGNMQTKKKTKGASLMKSWRSRPIIKLMCMSNSKKVSILGVLKNPYKYIDECDILVTPFKNPHFSRPAIESFAYGKPVVGSDVVGMDEIIDHDENGLLFKKSDAKGLADAINFLCDNPDIARKMGINGRKKAIAFFSPEPNMCKVVNIYKSVTAK